MCDIFTFMLFASLTKCFWKVIFRGWEGTGLMKLDLVRVGFGEMQLDKVRRTISTTNEW